MPKTGCVPACRTTVETGPEALFREKRNRNVSAPLSRRNPSPRGMPIPQEPEVESPSVNGPASIRSGGRLQNGIAGRNGLSPQAMGHEKASATLIRVDIPSPRLPPRIAVLGIGAVPL